MIATAPTGSRRGGGTPAPSGSAISLGELDRRAIKRHNEHPWLGQAPDPSRRSTLHDRTTAPEPLFTSDFSDVCLTHMVRFVTRRLDGNIYGVTALCGQSQTSKLLRWVPVADETFVCIRCHRRAVRYEVDTFGLIPDSGCSVSGGKLGRKLGSAAT